MKNMQSILRFDVEASLNQMIDSFNAYDLPAIDKNEVYILLI